MKKRTSIYVLIDPRTNLIRYVGKTVQKLSYRLTQHLTEKSNHKRSTWIKSLKNKGLIPIIEEIDFCDWEESSNLEINWIKKYRLEGVNLTNMTDGGDGTIGIIPTKEQLELRSKIMKEKFKNGLIPSMLGKTHTKEAREKISKVHKGVKRSDEFKEKRRIYMTNRIRSSETIAKVRKIHLIPIVKLNPSDCSIVKIYEYLKQAHEQDGYTESRLIDCCKGRTKIYRGYKWMYLSDYEEFKNNPKLYEKYKN